MLEAFGAGNMPDNTEHHWLQWLKEQREAGLQVRAQLAACATCVWSLSTPVKCCLWHCLHACNMMQSWLLLQVYLSSQCLKGELRVCWLTRSKLSSPLCCAFASVRKSLPVVAGGLQPDLYASGAGAIAMGCEAGPLMTVSSLDFRCWSAAVVKSIVS